MKKLVLLPFAVCLSSHAVAQHTSCTRSGPFTNCNSSSGAMTTCHDIGGGMSSCNTIGGHSGATNGGNAGAQSYQGDSGAALGSGLVDFVRAMQFRKARAKVAKALKAGDCPTATVEAVDSGSDALAKLVMNACY